MTEQIEPGRMLYIDADLKTRAGVHADVFTARTTNGVTSIDFILTDLPGDDDDSLRGVLASRVFINNENLIALRDMLINHTKNWQAPQEDADAE